MKAIFFDGDDTLWAIDRLYQQKQQTIAAFVSEHYDISYDFVLYNIMQADEAYLCTDQKFTHTLFPMTNCRTVAELVPNISHEHLLKVYSISDEIFNFEPKLSSETIEVLLTLGSMGYVCMILTLGDYMVQASKIFRTKLYNFVADSLIVDAKNVATYQDIMQRYPTIERFIMVGDSYKKDIVPAYEAGWTTIHLCHEEPAKLEDRKYRIDNLKQVLSIIKEIDRDGDSIQK